MILSILLSPPANAETKKSKAQKEASKETVKKKIAKRAEKKTKEALEKVKEEEAKPLDLNFEDKILLETTPYEIRENIDLDSQYAPAAPKRGDVSVNPEFRIVDDPDINKNDGDKEKEFKLKFGVGL